MQDEDFSERLDVGFLLLAEDLEDPECLDDELLAQLEAEQRREAELEDDEIRPYKMRDVLREFARPCRNKTLV